MTTRGHGVDALSINHPATTPVAFTGGDDPRVDQPVDLPSRAIFVFGGVPYVLTNAAPAPLTSAVADGTFLRTIDGGTTPVAIQGSTNKKVKIRLKTFKLGTAGFVAVQAAVKVYIGRAAGAPDVTVGTFTTGTGTVVVGAADLSGAATPAVGAFITSTLGLLEVEITFTNTDTKVIVLEYGGDQYLLSVALA